jgi:hypothetical protein
MITTRILRPEDQAQLEAFLVPRVASSMFLLSNSRKAGLTGAPGRYHGTYAGAFAGTALGGSRRTLLERDSRCCKRGREHAPMLTELVLRAVSVRWSASSARAGKSRPCWRRVS